MKILAFIGQMHKGGAERVMSLLVNDAASRGYDISLLLGRNIVEYEIDKRVRVISLDSDDLNPINRYKRIRQVFKEEAPDAIISFMSSSSIYACLCAIGTDIPVVISERNTPKYEVSDRMHGMLRTFAYRFASGAIFQTEQARDYFSKKLHRNSVVIPNPVKDNLPVAERNHVKKQIVTLGRLVPQKNHKLLIRSFSMFLNTHTDYELVIYGRGKTKESKMDLLAYAESLGVNNKVSISDPIDNVHEEIKDSAMFVLSSDYEGVSNALLECLAVGLPCISTDCPCGGSRMLIKDGQNGLLVPVGDADGLCKAMGRIADDGALADRIGNEAKKVRDKYSAKEIMGRYLDYIISVSKERKNTN